MGHSEPRMRREGLGHEAGVWEARLWEHTAKRRTPRALWRRYWHCSLWWGDTGDYSDMLEFTLFQESPNTHAGHVELRPKHVQMRCTQKETLEKFLEVEEQSESMLLKLHSEQSLAEDPVPRPGNLIFKISKEGKEMPEL